MIKKTVFLITLILVLTSISVSVVLGTVNKNDDLLIESIPINKSEIAQEPLLFNKFWAKGYGGQNLSETSAGLAPANEGYVVTGMIWYESEAPDFYLLWVDEIGNATRMIHYDPGDINIVINDITAVEVSPGLLEHLIVGYSQEDGDICIIRIDGNGDIVWGYLYDHLTFDKANAIQTYEENGNHYFAITGITVPTQGQQDARGLIMTINLQGDVLSAAKYYYTEGVVFYDIECRFDGGSLSSFAVAGVIDFGTADSSALLVNVDDSDLSINWVKQYDVYYSTTSFFDVFYALKITSDGGYILAGTGTSDYSASNDDMFLVKTNDIGVVQWAKSYYVWEFRSEAYSVDEIPDIGYVVTGSITDYWNSFDQQMFLAVVDTGTGAVVNSRYLQKGKPEFPCNSAIRKAVGTDLFWNGNAVMVAGWTSSSFNEEFLPNNIIIAKMSRTCRIRWGCCSESFEFDTYDNVITTDPDLGKIDVIFTRTTPNILYNDVIVKSIYLCNDYLLVFQIDWPLRGSISIFDLLKFPIKSIAPTILIIGKVTVEVTAHTDEGNEGIHHVEFMVNDEAKAEDSDPPYEWLWRDIGFGKAVLRVIVFGEMGEKASIELPVIKIL